ncbi:Alpha-amylase precursor [Leclercia adecarboxylata]|uniref:Alpha-amylase n=1 Tax=Leclercia adecarboxylata TaxID=83655 RepID=A0A4U9I1M9_9ENTR|nr:Alpha-amylase precursor [Leclercia adecarboxylata]
MEQTQCDGFRLDAVKHIPAWFYKEWIEHVQEVAPKPLFIRGGILVAGMSINCSSTLIRWTGKTMLFDAPLHMKFHQASLQGRDYDMSQIFTGTLVEADPLPRGNAGWLTTTPSHYRRWRRRSRAWFKPLAYALILLRENGVPSVLLSRSVRCQL